jgi:hypothetical protein
MVIPRLKSLYHYGYICADAIVDTLVQQYLMYGSYLQIHEGELAFTTRTRPNWPTAECLCSTTVSTG